MGLNCRHGSLYIYAVSMQYLLLERSRQQSSERARGGGFLPMHNQPPPAVWPAQSYICKRISTRLPQAPRAAHPSLQKERMQPFPIKSSFNQHLQGIYTGNHAAAALAEASTAPVPTPPAGPAGASLASNVSRKALARCSSARCRPRPHPRSRPISATTRGKASLAAGRSKKASRVRRATKSSGVSHISLRTAE